MTVGSRLNPLLTLEYMRNESENKYFDRKSGRIKVSDLASHISAFANADGGTLVIGISDKKRTLEGINFCGDVKINEFINAPKDCCRPMPRYREEFLDITNENGIQDCSRGNTYHNRRFKAAAEAHGLIVEHSDKYGWSHTSPSDELLDFILENGLTDILISRNEFAGFHITGTGTHSGTGTTPPPPRTSSTRKYICPCCGNSVRATKEVHIACLDCSAPMVLAG